MMIVILASCNSDDNLQSAATPTPLPPTTANASPSPANNNDTTGTGQNTTSGDQQNTQAGEAQPEQTRSNFISYQGLYDNTLTGHLPVRRNRVSIGDNHTLIIDDYGTVWGMGSDSRGQLATIDRSVHMERDYEPYPVEILHNVALVRASGRSSFAVTNGGALWVISHTFPALLPPENAGGRVQFRYTTYPTRIMDNVVDIQIGGSHILILTSNGDVWAGGSNASGQIEAPATPGNTRAVEFRMVMENVVYIAAGPMSSLAITESGDIYAWGGVLGHGVSASGEPVPRMRLDGLGDLTRVSFQEHPVIAAVRADGAAVTVHNTEIVAATEDVLTFEPIVWQWDDFSLLKYIVTLGGINHRNTFMLFDDGRLQGSGSNTYGLVNPNEGVGRRYRIDSPQTIMENVAYFATGQSHAVAIDFNGQVWVWGANNYGQLGLGHTSDLEGFSMLSLNS